MSDRKCLENERILQTLAGTMGCNSLCSTLFRFHWVCVQPLAVSVDKTSVWSLILCTPRVLHVANLPYYEQTSFHQEKNDHRPNLSGGLLHVRFGVTFINHPDLVHLIVTPGRFLCNPMPRKVCQQAPLRCWVSGWNCSLVRAQLNPSCWLRICQIWNTNRAQTMDHARLLNVKTGVVWKQRVLKDVSEQVWCVRACLCESPTSLFFPRDPRVSVKRFCPNPARAGLGNGAWGTRDTCDAGSSASDGLKWRNGNGGKRVTHVETGETTCCCCCCCQKLLHSCCNLVTSGAMLDP